ncbi:MAG: DUF2254 domain-containing protein [Chthoniobacteraceae bacterium]
MMNGTDLHHSIAGKLRKFWIEIRSSLWFVPGLLVLAAAVLAVVLVEVDVAFAEKLQQQRWEPLLNAGAEGARGMLTAIASSMITVAGVAFSITIVTLSLASTQYTPRILRNFMRDRANQVVLGFFVAVYTYCLIVLRTIRGGGEEDGSGFVPLLAVAVGMLMALLSIGFLIFFIHHVATSIQASTILKAITEETARAIDTLYPEELEPGEEERISHAEIDNEGWAAVDAPGNGYLQHIDAESLMELAEKHETTLMLASGAGDFVIKDSPLLRTHRKLDEAAEDSLRACFVIADFRTVHQDAGFGIRQIVDIASKALSPGVNDTSTAVSCLDYLAAILSRLASRRIGSAYEQADGEQRVFGPAERFERYLAKALDEIRHNARGNVIILRQLLCVIRRVSAVTRSPARRSALLAQARLTAEYADQTLAAPYERRQVNDALVQTRETLGAAAGELPDMTAAQSRREWD